ncbi:MAG: DUF502 domain-containing protein [Candidatus Nanohaloarchaea archaeon]
MSDERDPEEELQDGKEQLQEGAQKIMQGGIAKGKRQKESLKYYHRNRSEVLEDLGFKFGQQKKPAAQGLIVLLPIFVVGLIVDWLFSKIEQVPYNEILNITSYYVINQSIKLAALLTIGTIAVTVTGQAVKTKSGFELEKLVDRIIGGIPFLGAIYRITKVTTETVIEGTEELSKPVKIEVAGMQMTAFKTGNTTEEGREILFMPTAPNISSGLILEVKPENIIETDESPEQALTRTLSAGFGQSKPVVEDDSDTS